jgi:hypothetical protein
MIVVHMPALVSSRLFRPANSAAALSLKHSDNIYGSQTIVVHGTLEARAVITDSLQFIQCLAMSREPRYRNPFRADCAKLVARSITQQKLTILTVGPDRGA